MIVNDELEKMAKKANVICEKVLAQHFSRGTE
jgi:hypothetical protein